MPRNIYNLVLSLTGPDPDAIPGGLVVAYTRNHALAVTVARYGITVNWKPWLKPEKIVRCARDGMDLRDSMGNLLAQVETDPNSALGIRTAWVSNEVHADILKAQEEERKCQVDTPFTQKGQKP